MIELTMEHLTRCFEHAASLKQKYVGVLIRMVGFEKDEVIINENANFDSKLEYYKKTYDENLNHKFAKGISISGFTSANNFNQIEHNLYNSINTDPMPIEEITIFGKNGGIKRSNQ